MHKTIPNTFIFLDRYNNKIFENNNTNIGIVYRNYKAASRIREAIEIAKACKKNNYKFFVSNDVKLALKLNANGIYIPSFNKKKNFNNLPKKNILILGSAHNQKEIQQKIDQKCEVIFVSPLFYNNKSKKYLGINRFNYLTQKRKIKFIALGGINEKNIKKLKMLRVTGFAGISVFKKKPAYKRPVF